MSNGEGTMSSEWTFTGYNRLGKRLGSMVANRPDGTRVRFTARWRVVGWVVVAHDGQHGPTIWQSRLYFFLRDAWSEARSVVDAGMARLVETDRRRATPVADTERGARWVTKTAEQAVLLAQFGRYLNECRFMARKDMDTDSLAVGFLMNASSMEAATIARMAIAERLDGAQ